MHWDQAGMRRDIDNAVSGYTRALATEEVTAEVGMVTAVLRLDGVLRDIRIQARAIRTLGAEGLGAALTEAIRAAELAAGQRRRELAGAVTFGGHPVFELIDEMINAPESAVRRLGNRR